MRDIRMVIICLRSRRDSNLDLNAGLERDRSNLLDDLTRRVQVDEPLVNLELVAVPGLGTLTARRLTGGDLEDLGGKANGALDTQLLVLCAVDQITAELLEVAHVTASEGDPDFVDFGLNGSACGIVVFFALRDVTHLWRQR